MPLHSDQDPFGGIALDQMLSGMKEGSASSYDAFSSPQETRGPLQKIGAALSELGGGFSMGMAGMPMLASPGLGQIAGGLGSIASIFDKTGEGRASARDNMMMQMMMQALMKPRRMRGATPLNTQVKTPGYFPQPVTEPEWSYA